MDYSKTGKWCWRCWPALGKWSLDVLELLSKAMQYWWARYNRLIFEQNAWILHVKLSVFRIWNFARREGFQLNWMSCSMGKKAPKLNIATYSINLKMMSSKNKSQTISATTKMSSNKSPMKHRLTSPSIRSMHLFNGPTLSPFNHP